MTEDGLATPIDFTARYGSGLDRGIVLGGGGVYFIAWQVAYLQALARGGVDLSSADRVVGTSAGSVVATALTAGHLGRLHAQVSALSRFPALLHALAPAVSLTPSQQRALDAFVSAPDADAERVRAIGRAALAANTPEAARIRANLQLVLQVGSWPSPALHVTAVDAYTGERCVVTESAGVRHQIPMLVGGGQSRWMRVEAQSPVEADSWDASRIHSGSAMTAWVVETRSRRTCREPMPRGF